MIKIKGTIKWYNEYKGFGFITGEDEKEYFVHTSFLQEGAIPKEGEGVTFDPAKNEKGLQAKNVQLD